MQVDRLVNARARARDGASRATAAPRSPLGAGELAWILAVPCALATLAAILALGAPLGRALLAPSGGEALWPPHIQSTEGIAEPEKHGRYVVALLGPLLLVAATALAARRRVRLRPRTRRALIAAGQAAALAFAILALLGQSNVVFPYMIDLWPIFPVTALVVAALAPLLLVLALRRARVRDVVARLARETRRRRATCLAVATAFNVLWALPAFDTERSIGHALAAPLIPWTMDDPFAVLDGRTPFVSFHPLYAHLWPYLAAGALRAFGTTITVYTATMTCVDVLILLALYALLRRIVRSSTLALALYLPVAAAGFLLVRTAPTTWLSNVTFFSMWPMRYGGAYVLAWLTARHLDGAAPRRRWALVLAAGLVALDNLEFGLAALAATLVALACAQPRWSRRAAGRLLADTLLGLAGAALLVTLLTLVRAGALPHFGDALEYPRIFGVLGLVALPMPTVGFQLVLYMTFGAALAVATVRLLAREPDRLLTCMLAWSGVFGLLAGGYFVGRSDMLKLVSLFSAWAFALALLSVVVVRRLAARGWRRPSLAELMVLAGLALAGCALRQLPTPWSQLARLRDTTPVAVFKQPQATRFVAAHTVRGEKVAILIELGHRIAYDLGLANVAPYSYIDTMVTRAQLRTLLDAMRREGAHRIFVPDSRTSPAHLQALAEAGFALAASRDGYSELVDASAVHGR